jgi:hypothetical protein
MDGEKTKASKKPCTKELLIWYKHPQNPLFVRGRGEVIRYETIYESNCFFLLRVNVWQTDKQSSGLTFQQNALQSSGSNFQWSN